MDSALLPHHAWHWYLPLYILGEMGSAPLHSTPPCYTITPTQSSFLCDHHGASVCMCSPLFPLFNLRHPPIFQVTLIPREPCKTVPGLLVQSQGVKLTRGGTGAACAQDRQLQHNAINAKNKEGGKVYQEYNGCCAPPPVQTVIHIVQTNGRRKYYFPFPYLCQGRARLSVVYQPQLSVGRQQDVPRVRVPVEGAVDENLMPVHPGCRTTNKRRTSHERRNGLPMFSYAFAIQANPSPNRTTTDSQNSGRPARTTKRR